MLLLKSTHETILALTERAHDAESDLQQNEIKSLSNSLDSALKAYANQESRQRSQRLEDEKDAEYIQKQLDISTEIVRVQAENIKALTNELLLLRRAGRITNVTEQSNYPLQDVEDTESTQATVEERVKLVRDAAAELERITSNFDASRVKPEIIAAQPKNSKEWEREHAPSSDAGDDIAVAVGTE
jgi:hypothetical protein